MTALEKILCRMIAADILLAVTWILLGGAVLEAIIFAMLQAGLLLLIEGVIRTVHYLVEDIEERRDAR